mmetsp:Transcript_139331/g.445523  ORF Transcript_139331/g.445523 Transcript_139331/m.445523 type:complete len:519 (+) Transcript_139331:87-1643(+)
MFGNGPEEAKQVENEEAKPQVSGEAASQEEETFKAKDKKQEATTDAKYDGSVPTQAPFLAPAQITIATLAPLPPPPTLPPIPIVMIATLAPRPPLPSLALMPAETAAIVALMPRPLTPAPLPPAPTPLPLTPAPLPPVPMLLPPTPAPLPPALTLALPISAPSPAPNSMHMLKEQPAPKLKDAGREKPSRKHRQTHGKSKSEENEVCSCDCSWANKTTCSSWDGSCCEIKCCNPWAASSVPVATTTPKPPPKVSDVEAARRRPSHENVFEFYTYRATPAGVSGNFEFGDINTGNMDGVMWYLQNEVVTDYSDGLRCPRKFGISEIHRFKVKMRATTELAKKGMNFGVRFAYDQGKCAGRCFSGNMCSLKEDCDVQYKQYGFVVGCNKFTDHYPFPNYDTVLPGGVWYSFPSEGRCRGTPTGAPNCTWSYEEAGSITLKEFEATASGDLSCCEGSCTNIWVDLFNPTTAAWRASTALDLFAKKYTNQPKDLPAPPCDFQKDEWYAYDPWPRIDPWDVVL